MCSGLALLSKVDCTALLSTVSRAGDAYCTIEGRAVLFLSVPFCSLSCISFSELRGVSVPTGIRARSDQAKKGAGSNHCCDCCCILFVTVLGG